MSHNAVNKCLRCHNAYVGIYVITKNRTITLSLALTRARTHTHLSRRSRRRSYIQYSKEPRALNNAMLGRMRQSCHQSSQCWSSRPKGCPRWVRPCPPPPANCTHHRNHPMQSHPRVQASPVNLNSLFWGGVVNIPSVVDFLVCPARLAVVLHGK